MFYSCVFHKVDNRFYINDYERLLEILKSIQNIVGQILSAHRLTDNHAYWTCLIKYVRLGEYFVFVFIGVCGDFFGGASQANNELGSRAYLEPN